MVEGNQTYTNDGFCTVLTDKTSSRTGKLTRTSKEDPQTKPFLTKNPFALLVDQVERAETTKMFNNKGKAKFDPRFRNKVMRPYSDFSKATREAGDALDIRLVFVSKTNVPPSPNVTQ